MTESLNIRMAQNVVGVRKTDWTFGAAWLFGSYLTCNLGADAGQVAALQAVFGLEEHSIASLENVLSSFL